MKTRPRRAVTGLAALAAVLYCLLMPLWEGWDEPYHYGVVQSVGIERRLSDTFRTTLSEEVRRSTLLAPASAAVQRDHPEVTSFEEFRALDYGARMRLRRELRALDPALQYRLSGAVNFEAQQAPLAYGLMAVADRLLAGAALVDRVLALRLTVALLAVVATALGVFRLGDALELPEPILLTAAALALFTQSFLATVCRISNDWLAVALAPWLLVSGVAVVRHASPRHAWWFGSAMAADLLSKASLLAFTPLMALVAVVLAVRRRLTWSVGAGLALPLTVAVPWYARNVALYGSLSGAGGSVWNRTPGQVWEALTRIEWWRETPGFARQALWSANSNGAMFSATTLHAALALLAAAGALCALRLWRDRGDRQAPLLVAAGAVLFTAALAYSIGDHCVMTGGERCALMAWYAPPLFPLAAVLAGWGLTAGGRAGRWLAAALVCLWTYIFAATWVVKLIPIYAGYPHGSVKLAALASWYAANWREAHQVFGAVTLGPVWLVYTLAVAAVAGAAAGGAWLVLQLIRSGNAGRLPASGARSSPR